MTCDHTLVQVMISGGVLAPEDAKTHPRRNVVTNVIGGPREGVHAEIHKLTIADGDVLLLCSDGLTEPVDDEEIAETLALHPEPEDACRLLVERALERGGPDNITVVVARYGLTAGLTPGRASPHPHPSPTRDIMIIRLAPWLLALAPLAASAAAARGRPTPPDLAIEAYRLPNGLKVVLHRDPAVPRVSVCVAYHVGSKDERAGRTGFAHFFEHMMFRGTQQRPQLRHPAPGGGGLSPTPSPPRT